MDTHREPLTLLISKFQDKKDEAPHVLKCSASKEKSNPYQGNGNPNQVQPFPDSRHRKYQGQPLSIPTLFSRHRIAMFATLQGPNSSPTRSRAKARPCRRALMVHKHRHRQRHAENCFFSRLVFGPS
jgi:hypothetical protein